MFRSGIRARLGLIFVLFVFALGAIWYSDAWLAQRVERTRAVAERLDAMQARLLALRQAEKDFVAHHRADARERFDTNFQSFQALALSLTADLRRQHARHASALPEVLRAVSAYRQAFVQLHDRRHEIGLHYGDGKYAELQQNAARIEEIVRDDPLLIAHLLQLRAHEKDFIIHHDPLHATRFATAISDFRGALFLSDLDNRLKASVQPALNDYYDLFQKLVQYEIEIGLDPEKGLAGAMRERVTEAETSFAALRDALDDELRVTAGDAKRTSRAILLSGIALTLALLAMTVRRITASLSQAHHAVTRLSRGQLDVSIGQIPNDEIGDVLNALEKMRCGLQETTHALRLDNETKSRNAELAAVLRGERAVDTLAQEALRFLAQELNGLVGVVFLRHHNDDLTPVAGYGVDLSELPQNLTLRESLAGQVAANGEALILSDAPPGYLNVRSGIGEAAPSSLLVLPLVWNEVTWGLLELGSFDSFPEFTAPFAREAGETLAVALQAAVARRRNDDLLQEARLQSEQLASRQLALEQANGDLARQAQALQESEARMQTQQEELRAQEEELRVMNEQLEEQFRTLNQRNRELERRNREFEEKLLARTA